MPAKRSKKRASERSNSAPPGKARRTTRRPERREPRAQPVPQPARAPVAIREDNRDSDREVRELDAYGSRPSARAVSFQAATTGGLDEHTLARVAERFHERLRPEALADLENLSWDEIAQLGRGMQLEVKHRDAGQARKLEKELHLAKLIVQEKLRLAATGEQPLDYAFLSQLVRLLVRSEDISRAHASNLEDLQVFLYLVLEKLKKQKLAKPVQPFPERYAPHPRSFQNYKDTNEQKQKWL